MLTRMKARPMSKKPNVNDGEDNTDCADVGNDVGHDADDDVVDVIELVGIDVGDDVGSVADDAFGGHLGWASDAGTN